MILRTFGCSYTKGLGSSIESFSWPSQLAQKLHIDYKNYGISGASNDFISVNVINELNTFDKNDLIIVMMTFADRKLTSQRNALPNTKWAKNYFKYYHNKELGVLNFIQNYLTLHHILKDKKYFITFTDNRPYLESKLYYKSVNLKNSNTILGFGKGYYNIVENFGDGRHPNDNGYMQIAHDLHKKIIGRS